MDLYPDPFPPDVDVQLLGKWRLHIVLIKERVNVLLPKLRRQK